MEEDEAVVQTSDQEELEELAATRLEYWQTTTGDIARRRHVIPTANDFGGDGGGQDASRSPRLPRARSPHLAKANGQPPHKRRKLERDSQEPSRTVAPPLSPSTNLPRPLPSSTSSASLSQLSAGKQQRESPSEVAVNLPKSSRISPASHYIAEDDVAAVNGGRHDGLPLDDISGGLADAAESSPVPAHGPPRTPPASRGRSTGSPASSPDPLLLFTPPGRRDSPQVPGQSSPTSSPLTPTSSPHKRSAEHRSPSPGPSRASPAIDHAAQDDRAQSPSPRSQSPLQRPAQPNPPHPPPPPGADLPPELADNADGRYSLRARKARQLHPYEYDKKLYKQQMRANPAAIIKVVSPPRPRRRHRSTSAGRAEVGDSSEAEDEYQGGDEEDAEMDEDARWERRIMKGRERARDHPSAEEATTEERGRAEMPAWLPEALRELSSGSSTQEEDKELDALERKRERERRKKEREERRKARKPKPFPVPKKVLQPPASPAASERNAGARESSPQRPRPRPRPRPRAIQQSPPGAGAEAPRRDEQAAGPSSPWRRQRSVTFTSPIRSPPRQDEGDAFAGWNDDNDDFAAFDDHDDHARANSPLALPLTPATDEGASSEGPVAGPPTSSTPAREVIELTDDEENNIDLPLPRRSRARSKSNPIIPALDSPSSSGSGSNSNSDSEDSVDEKTRRQMKALSRMMPAVLIKRLQQKPSASSRARERSRSQGHSGHDNESESGEEADRPLRPGESRRRVRSRTLSSRSIEIRGDSESSDVPMDVDLNDAPPPPDDGDAYMRLSDGENEIRPIAHQPRARPRFDRAPSSRSVISVSDDSDEGGLVDSEISSSEKEAGARRRARYDGEAREGDLIDRMLSRTSMSSSRRRAKRKRRVGGTRRGGGGGGGGGGSGGGGAHHGGHRAGGGTGGGGGRTGGGGTGGGGGHGRSGGLRVTTGEPVSPPPNEVHFAEEAQQKKSKSKKQKLKPKPNGLYVFSSGGAHLVTGRAHAGHITVDQEAAAHAGPSMRNAGRSSPRPPRSKGKRIPSTASHAPTLEEFWTLGGVVEESDDSFVVPDGPLPHPLSSQQARDIEQLHRVTVDMDVHPLPAGIAFPNTTYLGRGWLYELINLLPHTQDVPSPPSCSMFDCYLHSEMSVEAFNACLESIYDQLRNLILGASNPAGHETCGKWQAFLHAVSQHLSWLLAKSTDGAYVALVTDAESLVKRLSSLMEEPVEVLPDDEKPNPLVLQALWFLVEASCRLACDRRRRLEDPDLDLVSSCIKALMAKLWDFTFGEAALDVDLSREGLTTPSSGQQIAELWVCLLNLANDKTFESTFLPPGASFWTLYLDVIKTKGLQSPPTILKAREAIWRSIFTLCALSQFSLHGNSSMTPRLSVSWQVIAAILERAPLSADSAVDKNLSKRSLRKRDEYVRVLVSRCLWLSLKWHWGLDVDGAALVFNRLLDVFKSRSFASMADEPSDFPSFLRHNDLTLLHKSNRSDTAFTLFLKLVVRAAEEMRRERQDATIPPKLKKILSLSVPVGSVPFTVQKPPTARELSMLYNRFSAVAVAIYLEPTVDNLKYRLGNARRYVKFEETNQETRRACIRGAMHLGILLRHLDLPLAQILEWLTDMTNVLIDEYQAVDTGKSAVTTQVKDKNWVVVSIQLLLGCVRRILETSSMNPEENQHKYPDPALLGGPWVTRVFSTATTLSSVLSTGDQIRRFVQAFLDARARVIPKPRRPTPRIIAEDSQESQYDYEQFELDLDDPELLAALGEDPAASAQSENKEKDKRVCQTIDAHILPAVYRLVCKHFNDPAYQRAGELVFDDADKWIDCWVGCASVIVQNGKKNWDFFFSYGPQSWETIVDPARRRRVGLRFMYMLLQLDPPAYQAYNDRFVDVLFASIAAHPVTLEHEYASLLFSIDRLHHPLFHNLPIDDPGDDGDYHLTKHTFMEKRLALLEQMVKNLSDNLAEEAAGDHSLTAANQIHITSVISFLSTMRDILSHLESGSEAYATYLGFCKAAFALLSRFPSLSNHTRLTTLMTWLRDVSQ
ncbi:hypothetical protein OH77DRAFT_1510566 [Trametes cingulata]|nr:hypothetical protein OH77DRAFT_1510566 [Trametes cingulata]